MSGDGDHGIPSRDDGDGDNFDCDECMVDASASHAGILYNAAQSSSAHHWWFRCPHLFARGYGTAGRCELDDQRDDEGSTDGDGTHRDDVLASDGCDNASGLYYEGAGCSQRCGEVDGADGG